MKSLIFLIVLSLISKVTGLFRDLSIGFVFGPGEILDTYIMVMMIPSIVLDLMSVAVNSCYIPLHKKFYSKNPSILIVIFLSCFVISVFFSIIIYFVNANIINYLMISTKSVNHEYINYFLFPVFLFVFTSIFSEFFKSILVCENREKYIPIITILSNLAFLFSIYKMNENLGYPTIAYCYCILAFVQLILGAFLSREYIVVGVYSLDRLSLKKVKLFIFKFLILLLPISVGSITNQLNKSVDKYLAVQFDSGSLSQLYFSQQLYAVLIGILVVNVVMYYYPKLCSEINNQKIVGIIDEVAYFLSFISLLIFVCSFFYSKELISIIMGYGKLEGGVNEISSIFIYYSSGLLFESVNAIYKRVFWAKGNTIKPVKITIFSVIINIIFSVILSRYIGLYGIILATVFSNIISFVFLAYYLFYDYKVKLNFYRFLITDLITFVPFIFIVNFYIKSITLDTYVNVILCIMNLIFGFFFYLIRRYYLEKKTKYSISFRM
ncbi:MAG: lipid II flippase MurJ [Vibrio anguillarum]|nr:lipid II flippase MurJ [Vibrio anguillarum]